MRRFFTLALLGVSLLALLGALGLGFMVATFQPNEHKESFRLALEENLGWKVTMHDELEVTFLPRVSLSTGRMTLTHPQSPAGGQVQIDDLVLSLALDPLFKGVLEVRDAVIYGASLEHDALPLLLGRNDAISPAPAAVERTPLPQAVTTPDPSVTPLADDAQSPVEAPPTAAPVPAASTQWRINPLLQSLTFMDTSILSKDAGKNEIWFLRLDRTDILNVTMKADIPVVLSGHYRNNVTAQKASFSLEGSARLHAAESLEAVIQAARAHIEGLGDLPLELNAACALVYDIPTGVLSLRDVKGSLGLASGGQPGSGGNGSAKTDVTAALEIRPERDGKEASLSGTIQAGNLDLDILLHGLDPSIRFAESDGGEIKGAPNFTRPKVSRILTGTANDGGFFRDKGGESDDSPKKSARQKPGAGSSSWKSGLFAAYAFDLALNADVLTYGKLPMHKAEAKLRSKAGQLSLPFNFEAFGASVSGTARANLAAKVPSFALACRIQGMHMGKMTTGLFGEYYMGGVGNASFDLSGHGNAWSTLLHSLKGKGSFQVLNGEIRGFNLIPKDIPYFAGTPENFLFQRLSASAVINEGNAITNDLVLDSSALSGRGGGTVHFAYGQLDLGMDFMLGGQAPAIPVFVSGPYRALSSTVDMEAFQRNMESSGMGIQLQPMDGSAAPYSPGMGYGIPDSLNRPPAGAYGQQPTSPYGQPQTGAYPEQPTSEAYQQAPEAETEGPEPPEMEDRGRIGPLRSPGEILWH